MHPIPLTPVRSWQDELRDSITDPAELLKSLKLPETLLDGANAGAALFSLRVPKPYLSRIEKGNPRDPLLLQILPLQQEKHQTSGFTTDPLEENTFRPLPGLIHKYKNRVLLILSGACAINCRYCFRRHFPYQENQLGQEQWQEILKYLQKHTDIDEVIFSGGDPLATPDIRLKKMIEDLEKINQIKRLRIHTRLPIVIPTRVTESLVDTLAQTRLKSIMVFHINHPNEIDNQVKLAISKLKQENITLLNQSVLLSGINNSVFILETLSKALFDINILPYYLFLLDQVEGAAHFDTSKLEARNLFTQLQAKLPGYLVPKLAIEIPHRLSKTLLSPLYDM